MRSTKKNKLLPKLVYLFIYFKSSFITYFLKYVFRVAHSKFILKQAKNSGRMVALPMFHSPCENRA